MVLKLMGKKLGMTQVFNEDGTITACTAIHVDTHHIVQVKDNENDRYTAIQLGTIKAKNWSKPLKGHYNKAKIEPCRYLSETRVKEIGEYEAGQVFEINHLEGISHVDVIGISKGKGYQGVMKLHGFSGGPAAHGSGFHRHAGSTGMRSTPGRCLPGGKRASRMGGERKTVQSLQVVKVDAEKKIMLVKGAVPGSRGSIVYISKAKKK